MASNGSGELPKFLILGGCGFIGRHMVDFLLDKSSKIFVVDKTPPEIAWLNGTHLAALQNPKVSFQTANLITQSGCEKAFGNVDEDIDYVINLASETRKGQLEPVYKEGIHKLAMNVAENVQKKIGSHLKTYVEFSTYAVYPSDKTPHKESAKVDTWSFEATYKYQAEKDLAKHIQKYVIVRPAIVYGTGDRSGITPRLVVGAVYKHLQEVMKLPWTGELKQNTVHVEDLVKATYHLCKNGKHGEVYNIVDKSDTTQGKISSIVSEIFDVKVDYWGAAFTTLAKMDVTEAIEDINEKHLGPWAKICSSSGVTSTPLSPYIHGEALTKRHVALDGTKLANSGFKEFAHSEPTKEAFLQILNDFADLNMFPKSSLL